MSPRLDRLDGSQKGCLKQLQLPSTFTPQLLMPQPIEAPRESELSSFVQFSLIISNRNSKHPVDHAGPQDEESEMFSTVAVRRLPVLRPALPSNTNGPALLVGVNNPSWVTCSLVGGVGERSLVRSS
jgi:hypothetical protein